MKPKSIAILGAAETTLFEVPPDMSQTTTTRRRGAQHNGRCRPQPPNISRIATAGDFNVMPQAGALGRRRVVPSRGAGGISPSPRARLPDALHPCERIYTFWDYFRSAWARNAGFRIDHLLLSPSITGCLVAADLDREVRGWEKASDHAPTWIELGSSAGSTKKRGGPRE